MIDIVIDITLLSFLVVTAIAMVRMTNLFAIIMLFGVFSFISAVLFVVMDASDVAFTEAAVGAGISTVLMLATIALIQNHHEKKVTGSRPWLPLFVVFVMGAALVYGTMDIPEFGDPMGPQQTHVASHYLEKSMSETGVPNVVTSVLASYRGFDTLGETAVVFTAGIAVLLLIGGRRSAGNSSCRKTRRDQKNGKKEENEE